MHDAPLRERRLALVMSEIFRQDEGPGPERQEIPRSLGEQLTMDRINRSLQAWRLQTIQNKKTRLSSSFPVEAPGIEDGAGVEPKAIVH
jgi:hypothetical protein